MSADETGKWGIKNRQEEALEAGLRALGFLLLLFFFPAGYEKTLLKCL